MRVCKCPNCQTIIYDNPLWRQSGFKWNADHTSHENFIQMHPEFKDKIKPKAWVEDELFLYHESKFGNVTRVAKFEYDKKSFMAKLTESTTKSAMRRFHVEELKKQTKLG